ncbi:hypothetical protein HKX48_003441 [Thoreauomyces humboldtii]|nr:hypothetical protein HKX48_003441 [Thoreauomyces humboldtii]
MASSIRTAAAAGAGGAGLRTLLLPPTLTRSILGYWFQGLPSTTPTIGIPKSLQSRWFAADPAIDQHIRDLVSPSHLNSLVEAVRTSETTTQPKEQEKEEAEDLLAAIVVLDQFSRNMFRGSAKAFENDPLARKLALRISLEGERLVPLNRRNFAFLPFMHSEDIADQRRCLDMARRWKDDCLPYPDLHGYASFTEKFARDHLETVERFGRFPHRNEVLGRTSTPEEIDYLAKGAATYGQSAKT